MKKRLAVFLSLAGIGCFIYILLRLDPALVLQHVQRISTEALLILLILRCIYWLIKTGCWWIILTTYSKEISFLSILRAHLSGNAIAYLTPTGRIGGEVLRFFMIKHIGKRQLLASIAVDKALEWMAGGLLILLCLFLAVIRDILYTRIFCIALISAIAAAILLLLFLFKKGPGPISGLYTGIIRIFPNSSRLSGQKERILEVESLIVRFFELHRGRFVAVLSAYVLKGLLWATEIYVTFLVLGALDVGFLKSFLLATLGSVSFLFPSLPGGVGVYEGTYMSLSALLKISMTSGMALVIIRRIIGLIMAGIGLIPLFFSRREMGDSDH